MRISRQSPSMWCPPSDSLSRSGSEANYGRGPRPCWLVQLCTRSDTAVGGCRCRTHVPFFRKDAETLLAAHPALNVQSSPPERPDSTGLTSGDLEIRCSRFSAQTGHQRQCQLLNLRLRTRPGFLAWSYRSSVDCAPFQVVRGAGDGEIRAAKGLSFSQQTLKRCIARCPSLEVCNAAESYLT